MEAYGTAWLLIVLFLIALAILWLLLPFALFGTKPLLREILAEVKKANALLEKLTLPTQQSPPALPTGRMEPILDAGLKGTCPNCGAIIPLSSEKCSGCGAQLGPNSSWKVKAF